MSVSWKIITFALQRDFHPSSLIIFEKVSLLIDSLKFRIYIGAKRIFLIIAETQPCKIKQKIATSMRVLTNCAHRQY